MFWKEQIPKWRPPKLSLSPEHQGSASVFQENIQSGSSLTFPYWVKMAWLFKSRHVLVHSSLLALAFDHSYIYKTTRSEGPKSTCLRTVSGPSGNTLLPRAYYYQKYFCRGSPKTCSISEITYWHCSSTSKLSSETKTKYRVLSQSLQPVQAKLFG